jgi:para-nitrobenzyl esterase
MKKFLPTTQMIVGLTVTLFTVLTGASLAASTKNPPQVTTENGRLQGITNADRSVIVFKKVPYAAPPIGELRWKPPRRAENWTGVWRADKFGPACLQTEAFGNLHLRTEQSSEDCLFLNVWVPNRNTKTKFPVIVWLYGGGFVTGDSSEPRYDGGNLAKKGVIVVIPNYRLGVFGFFSHPDLTKESPNKASGNYGLLDQVAALEWVARNIASFGGDPHNVTLAGQSAGSFSVSVLMASPLAQGLFQKAIGESGGFYPPLTLLADAEKAGEEFVKSVGANSMEEMRKKSGAELLQAAAKYKGGFGFDSILDGHVLPIDPITVYKEGRQSHIPLLAGWNADEGKMSFLSAPQKTTAKSFAGLAQSRFGGDAAEFLKFYPADSDERARTSAEELADDDFSGFSTWKWIEMHRKTGDSPAYEYHFEQVPAIGSGESVGSKHSDEIEYVFQTLNSREGVVWTAKDRQLSDMVSSYWVNFAKVGDPNFNGSPNWPKYSSADSFQVMHLSGRDMHASADATRSRYEFLDSHALNPTTP